MRALFIGMCAMLLPCACAQADDVVGYAGDPDGCFVSVKREPADDMLHVYPFGRTSSRACDVTQVMLEEALDAALKQTKTSSEPQPLRLIFLGRVADYPWLSQGLSNWAKQSPDWDSVKGHAAAGGPSDNAVVANMLTQMAMADQGALSFLLTLLSRHGFRFSGASVEKVMAGPDGQYGTTPVVEPVLPYDALVHLRIGKIR